MKNDDFDHIDLKEAIPLLLFVNDLVQNNTTSENIVINLIDNITGSQLYSLTQQQIELNSQVSWSSFFILLNIIEILIIL